MGSSIPGDLTLSIEGAGLVELGVVGPEEGTTTLSTVEAGTAGAGFDLLAQQLTDGVTSQALNVYGLSAMRLHNLGSGADGSLMVRLAPDATAGVADLAGEQITALQATVRISERGGNYTVSGVVRVFGLAQDESTEERAVALLQVHMPVTTNDDYLPGRIAVSTPITPGVVLGQLQEGAEGNQGMVWATDDVAFAAVTDHIKASPLTSLSTKVSPRPGTGISHVNQILPLVGDAATADYLTGLRVSGLRYHSRAALDFSNGLIAGATVIFATPE
jgi:hypothetical protein